MHIRRDDDDHHETDEDYQPRPLPVVHVSQRPNFGSRLSDVKVGEGLPDPTELKAEILHMYNVLLGREVPDSHIDSPYLDLCEIATGYYGRASEISDLIHGEEQEHRVMRGHPLYKIRTGQLRNFMDFAKLAAQLGSRRLTEQRLIMDERIEGS